MSAGRLLDVSVDWPDTSDLPSGRVVVLSRHASMIDAVIPAHLFPSRLDRPTKEPQALDVGVAIESPPGLASARLDRAVTTLPGPQQIGLEPGSSTDDPHRMAGQADVVH